MLQAVENQIHLSNFLFFLNYYVLLFTEFAVVSSVTFCAFAHVLTDTSTSVQAAPAGKSSCWYYIRL